MESLIHAHSLIVIAMTERTSRHLQSSEYDTAYGNQLSLTHPFSLAQPNVGTAAACVRGRILFGATPRAPLKPGRLFTGARAKHSPGTPADALTPDTGSTAGGCAPLRAKAQGPPYPSPHRSRSGVGVSSVPQSTHSWHHDSEAVQQQIQGCRSE